MNNKRAKEILKNYIRKDNSLHSYEQYTSWNKKDKTILLDGDYSIELLEALVYWMKKYSK